MLHIQELTTLSISDAPYLIGIIIFHAIFRYAVSYGLLVRITQLFQIKAGMKFVHRAFDLIHYSISCTLGFVALLGRPYSNCTYWGTSCAVALLPTSGGFICTILEKLYYLNFAAYYVVGLLFVNTVPNDVFAVTCHHITTLAMIFFAVLLHVPVIGFVVMLLHDVVDVPLYLGKVAGYLNWRLTKDVGMITFVALCTWFRMINYPILVYHMWMNLPAIVHLKELYKFTAVLLLVLFVLHIYWHVMIVKAVVALLKVGEQGIRDTRSE
jgi:hypothetical protein